MEEKDFEPAGLIPRSIIRTVERFRQQLRPETIALGIQEFRISRYQVRVSVRYFFILLLLPIAINWGTKNIIIKPLVGYFWNTYGTSLFLNSYQAERAFKEMRDFESQLFFEMLLSNPYSCPETNTNFLRKEQLLDKTWSTSSHENKHKRSAVPGGYMQNKSLEIKSQQKNDACDGPKGLESSQLALQESTTQNIVLLSLQSSPKSVDGPKGLRSSQLTWPNKLCLLTETSFRDTNIIKNKAKYNKFCSETAMLNKENLPLTPLLENRSPLLVKPTILNANRINTEVSPYNSKFLGYQSYNPDFLARIDRSNCFEVLFQEKTYLLAEIYNQQSITALSNMFGDCIMIISIILLLRFNAPQFTILKSFLIESFYSFNDAIKCFYIILITDFLVGFHSPRGWEIVMEMVLRHLGLPENEEFILLFVGTFPVFLDTAFKYWIFRYLNKISPSTVATYHSMIE